MYLKYLSLIAILTICNYGCTQKVENNNPLFLPKLVELVQEHHLSPKVIDEQLSKKILTSFLEKVDPEKRIWSI